MIFRRVDTISKQYEKQDEPTGRGRAGHDAAGPAETEEGGAPWEF